MREGPVWMTDFTIDETAREDAVALGLAGDLDTVSYTHLTLPTKA